MKFGIATGLTAWRDWRGIEGAIKDRNAGHLGGQIATALMFALSLFMGSPYAKYFAWITPEVANELGGVLAAGAAALFGWGHLSGNGVVAAVAASDGAAPSGTSSAAGQVASPDPVAEGQAPGVQPAPNALSRQDSDTMRAGG
jgi:hypothetical protein